MKINKSERRLRTIFYTPYHPAGFTGNVKDLDPQKKPRTLKWLSQQEAYTKHKSLTRRFKRRRVIVLSKGDTWGADLMDMNQLKNSNSNYNYVLVIIDLFSKKIDLRPLKRKTPEHIIEAFDDIVQKGTAFRNEPTPVFLQSDSGKEFSKRFKDHVWSKYHIKHYYLLNPDIKSSITERVIRTVKSRLYRYMTHKETKRYIDILPALVQSYNNRYHSSIGMTPNEVTFSNQAKVRENLYGVSDIDSLLQGEVDQLSANTRLRQSTIEYKIGDHVRISKYKNIFGRQKGYTPNFTNEVFVIMQKDSSIKGRSRVLYRLEDLKGERIAGRFYSEELVKVS